MNTSNGVNYSIIINMMSLADRNFSAPDTAPEYHHSVFSPLLVKMSLWVHENVSITDVIHI